MYFPLYRYTRLGLCGPDGHCLTCGKVGTTGGCLACSSKSIVVTPMVDLTPPPTIDYCGHGLPSPKGCPLCPEALPCAS